MPKGLREKMSSIAGRLSPKRLAAVGATAVVAVGAVAALALGTAVAAEGLRVDSADYPAGTTAISDASTMDSYKLYPTGDKTTSFDTTEFAGRLWTDKTVVAPANGDALGATATFGLADGTRDFDPDDDVPAGTYEVDKTASGTFLTCISALSSSLTTQIEEPVPLDIVLVLDLSGSMRTRNGYSDAVTSGPGSVSADDPNDHNTVDNGGSVYCIKEDGVYKQIRHTTTQGGVRYYDQVDGGNFERYYFTTDANLDGTPYGGNQNYRYALIYKRNQLPSRMTELQDAAAEFLKTIAETNSELASKGYSTDSMSQVAMVNFSATYRTQSGWVTEPYTPSGNDIQAEGKWDTGKTAIITPFTTYTDEGLTGTADVDYGVNIVSRTVNPTNSTASDYGLKLAQALFDGRVTYVNNYAAADRAGTLAGMNTDPARSGAKKVVIFFTDGNPKHRGNNAPYDFHGQIAEQTINAAEELKEQDTAIYAVAMLNGADPDDLTLNTNIYLNGVSSNYTGANVISSTNTSVLGFIPPAENSWTVDTSTWTGSNQGYFMVVGGDTSVSDAFKQIATKITSSDAADASGTGRDGNTAVTITDYLGDYMEFKGLDGILYGITADTTKFYAPGTQGAYHEQAQVQRDDASATQSTYTMWPKDPVPSALLSAMHEDGTVDTVSLNLITVKVTRSTDPKTGDTVTVTIPPELIPSLRYSVEQTQEEGQSVQTVVARTDADQLRIFYSVGPKTSTLSGVIGQLEEQALRSENATNESDRQTEAYKKFMEVAAADGQDGIYKLFGNRPPETAGTAEGTTAVAMTLSTGGDTPEAANPFYYYTEDEPLYVKVAGDEYAPATSSNYADGTTLYVRHRVWTVGQTDDQMKYIEFSGTPTQDGDRYIVTAGSPKVSAGDFTSSTIAKVEPNGGATGTAAASLVSAFAGGSTATQNLGNNGMLSIPVFGTLASTKNITAGAGFDLPTDPVPSASFTLTLKSAEGTALAQQNTYRALIRDANGHPVDPTTHAQVTSADSAKFYVVDGSTFELRDGETIKVTNLPDGATYGVREAGQAGYAATVTNNDGTKQEFARGVDANTAPASATP